MILLTGYYRDPDPARHAELLDCIERNCANRRIDEIHLFVEDASDPAEIAPTLPSSSRGKIHFVARHRRTTYRELFSYANHSLAGRDVSIANGDIFFDHSLGRLCGYDLRGKLLCLSRWDVQPDGAARLFDHAASQDAWIFRPPIAEFPCDFQLGVPACDNRLAWEAAQAGLAISNPSRSIRAFHLHLSGVRRYSERNRLHGPVAGIASGVLGMPWLWFVVTRPRPGDRQRWLLDALSRQTRSSSLVVDGSSATGNGIRCDGAEHDVAVVAVGDKAYCNGAAAMNGCASFADSDGILCFIDGSVVPAPGLSEYILSHIGEGRFFAGPADRSAGGTPLACRKAEFDGLGGLDEAFRGWGEEIADFRTTLQRFGVVEQAIPGELLLPPAAGAAPTAGQVPIFGRDASRGVHAAYRRAKSAILKETGDSGVPASALGEVYREIARSRLSVAAPAPDVPHAVVEFRERMGYSIARLEPGVSSHNNDWRPITSIPAPLAGLAFTQVVSCSVSPVHVELLTAGKLYVLVGTDWEGGRLAAAWLADVATREAIPPLRTAPGADFEVWSLIGDAGDAIVLPTQVMLIAAHLVRR